MAKKIEGYINLQIQAGQANPSPPVGPALGKFGVNIMEFCKAFNAQTQEQAGWVIPVVITVYADRSFTFITKTPPVSDMIKKALKIEKGSGNPSTQFAGKLSQAQLRDIAEKKISDMNASSIESAMEMVAGTARSMGVQVEG